jgi:hypothetical protein
MRRPLFPILSLALAAASLCNANINYNVNQTIGSGSVTGIIETDGTLGVLRSSNILSWNLLISDGATTVDSFGPVIGSAAEDVDGAGLSATPTQLLFDFNPSDDPFGYPTAFFFLTSVGPTQAAWIACDLCGAIVPVLNGEDLEIYSSGIQIVNDSVGLSGTQVIGTTSMTPEPSYFIMCAGIIALIGFRRLRIKQQQAR